MAHWHRFDCCTNIFLLTIRDVLYNKIIVTFWRNLGLRPTAIFCSYNCSNSTITNERKINIIISYNYHETTQIIKYKKNVFLLKNIFIILWCMHNDSIRVKWWRTEGYPNHGTMRRRLRDIYTDRLYFFF